MKNNEYGFFLWVGGTCQFNYGERLFFEGNRLKQGFGFHGLSLDKGLYKGQNLLVVAWIMLYPIRLPFIHFKKAQSVVTIQYKYFIANKGAQ